MGVMAREQDELYVITSDRKLGDSPSKIAPKRPNQDDYQVWTGDQWSVARTDAMTFGEIEEADEYIKENLRRLMENG